MLDGAYIIILASGVGQRFKNKGLPKQLTDLDGKPVLCYSIESAVSLVKNERVILTYPAGMLSEFQHFNEKFGYGVRLIEGGKRRQDSVLNAIKTIKDKKSILLIHDSARPLASKELFERVYNCAELNGACVPVISPTDTVKEVVNGIIRKTIDRKAIGLSQTPQGFRIEVLKRVLDVCDFETEYTDEAMLLESHGVKVHTVEGERFNLKLTFQEDLDIIKAFKKILCKTESE